MSTCGRTTIRCEESSDITNSVQTEAEDIVCAGGRREVLLPRVLSRLSGTTCAGAEKSDHADGVAMTNIRA